MTTGEIDQRMARARQELAVVHVLGEAGFGEAAVSRSYYAAFYAAEAALKKLGQDRSTHGGVVAAFGQFVVLPGGMDREAGRALRTLFDLRNLAENDLAESSPDDVEATAEQARLVVAAVADWLER